MKFLSMLLWAWSVAAFAQPATMLVYERSEAGRESERVRVIVTSDYMRMDQGTASGDYVLYDRKGRIIFSVAHEQQSIVTMESRPMEAAPPVPLNLREEAIALGEQTPDVGGRTPVRWRMLSGKQVCQEVVAVPGLLQDAVDARREMIRVIAAEHAATLPSVPADLHDACDLAVNIFNAEWVTRFGLPIHEQDFAGNSQVLVDYSEKFEVEPELFRLPEGYRRFSISAQK